MNSLVFSIAKYGSESWTMRKTERKRINSFELWAWRRLLRISWQDRITNNDVLNAVGNPESLLNQIVKSQLTYFGHICRRDGSSLEKTMLLGSIEGTRGRGRPRIRWLDTLTKQTGKTLRQLTEMSQNRVDWRKFVNGVTRVRFPD